MPVLQILCDTTVPASYMNFFEDSSKAWMVRYIFSIGQYFSWVHAQHGRFIEKQSSHVVQGHKLTNCPSGTSTDTQTWESTGLSALLKLSMHLPAQMQEATLFNVVGEKNTT